MILNHLITKYEYYIIISYILTIMGIIINYYINLINPLIFLTLLITISSIIFLSIFITPLFKIENKNEYFIVNLYKWNYIKPLKSGTKEKYIAMIKLITAIILILIPIINGCYCYALNISKSPSYLKLICFAFETTLIYTIAIRNEVFQKDAVLSSIYAAFIFIALIIMIRPEGLELINQVLNYMIHNLTKAFTVLIAIIMLCVGLSALSFGYCSILKEDSKIRKKMKENGEGYFISAILSMIAILLLFINSIIKPHVVFMKLTSLNIFSWDFILLNIYSSFMILIFTFTIYSSYCMLKCSISSLKELKLFEKYR